MKDLFFKHHKILFFFLALFFVYQVFRNSLSLLFFSFTIAVVVEPAYRKIQKKLQTKGILGGFWSDVILFLFVFVCSSTVLVILLSPFIYLKYNFEQLSSTIENIVLFIDNSLVSSHLSSEWLAKAMADMQGVIAGFFAGRIKSIPGLFGSLLVFYISLFYMIFNFRGMKASWMDLVPSGWKKVLKRLSLKSYLLFRSFYLVHIFIAVVVFCLSMLFFFFMGFKDVLLFSILTGILQMIPFVGAASVMIGLTVFYGVTEQIAFLLMTILIGFPFLVIIPEMVLRPMLMGKRAHISMVVVMLGLLCGVSSLGMVGLIAGPFILSMAQELFDMMHERYANHY